MVTHISIPPLRMGQIYFISDMWDGKVQVIVLKFWRLPLLACMSIRYFSKKTEQQHHVCSTAPFLVSAAHIKKAPPTRDEALSFNL
jgi:hypothetical protein